MSKLGIVLIIVVLAVGGIGACFLLRPQPDFQVKGLSLSQDKIAKGNTFTAQVKVTNVGDAEGTHTVKLKIENETLKKKVTLGPGESRTVSFDIEKQEKGTYNLNIEDLSETFEVVEPAEFKVSNMTFSQLPVKCGENVRISVDVSNLGETKGRHTVKLTIDDEVENSKTVTLRGGENTTLSFVFRRENSGLYFVDVGKLHRSVRVESTREKRKIQSLMEFVSEVRGLDFERSVPVSTIDKLGLRNLYGLTRENQLRAESEGETKTLRAFGLLGENESVVDVQENWLQRTWALYVWRLHGKKVNQIYVAEGRKPENHVLVHELTHALQDQHFDLSSLSRFQGKNENNDDLSLAVEALIEGEARYVEYRYMTGENGFGEVYDPTLLRRKMNPRGENFSFLMKCNYFPYNAGLIFIVDGREDNWKSINETYENPPVSTEQVLHPNKYFENRDHPTILNLPDVGSLLGSDWRLLDNGNFGEYATGLMFLKHLSGPEEWENNIRARNGWDGDSYLSYSPMAEKDNTVALVWLTTWDTEENAAQFLERYREVLDRKYPDAEKIFENENQLVLGIGTSREFLEMKGKDVLVLEGISAEKLEYIANEIWENTERHE